MGVPTVDGPGSDAAMLLPSQTPAASLQSFPLTGRRCLLKRHAAPLFFLWGDARASHKRRQAGEGYACANSAL